MVTRLGQVQSSKVGSKIFVNNELTVIQYSLIFSAVLTIYIIMYCTLYNALFQDRINRY